MMPAAVFFPVDPEQSPFDLIDVVRKGLGEGLRLYTNGRQMALLPKPVKGWALFGLRVQKSPHPTSSQQM